MYDTLRGDELKEIKWWSGRGREERETSKSHQLRDAACDVSLLDFAAAQRGFGSIEMLLWMFPG
mgnify:FL=1